MLDESTEYPFKAPKLIATDHWEEQEVDNLRQDLEEAELLQKKAEDICGRALDQASDWSDKYHAVKRGIKQRVDDMNGELRAKSMIYLNLIAEYEKLIGQQAPDYLQQPTIQSLRRRGGLQV